ncbi:MAG: helix-turn-helix domain-containing protein [Deltaproteobacteria bacterium]|nr:helix-turn-helix domain-containing protein [Deltaproteobacteria bacterium]
MTQQIMTKRYVSIKTVSEYTSIPVKPLYEWAAQGKIPSIKIGRRRLFDLKEIDSFMESMKHPYNQHEKTANKIITNYRNNDI